jgi:hypothetical protein
VNLACPMSFDWRRRFDDHLFAIDAVIFFRGAFDKSGNGSLSVVVCDVGYRKGGCVGIDRGGRC